MFTTREQIFFMNDDDIMIYGYNIEGIFNHSILKQLLCAKL